MRLLKLETNGEFNLDKIIYDDVPPYPYAILSHTWGADDEEVTFRDLEKGTCKSKTGYTKLQFCGKQAKNHGLEYFWVDTCCINKPDLTELSTAINSMFRWYRKAAKCYVYLSDVSIDNHSNIDQSQRWWEPDFRKSRWFTRGWTLQELLAPRSVEFFSREGELLGNKTTLEQQIHEITGIHVKALQGSLLSDFSVEERMSWAETRKTKLKEDQAYSLFGIFDVSLPVLYGEGKDKAFRRLKQQIHQDNQVIKDLHVTDSKDNKTRDQVLKDLYVTDPRDDKTRIQDTKGGLLRDSYRWILDHDDFRRWRNDPQSRLLWIKGDPGKGKTMLLCGIIDELEESRNPLSYFFCQATDALLSKAESVLRGLIYLLIIKKPSLISHLREKYDVAGEKLFQRNVWESLKTILTSMLDDPSSDGVTLVIDALDECITGRPKLLDFLVRLPASSRAKWIVSSRNWRDIEERLDNSTQGVRVCLELNENSISAAVRSYIREKVSQLANQKRYDDKTKDIVESHLISNANDTFLWVALACQELADFKIRNKRHTMAKLKSFPPGLDSLYERMMEYINESADADLCKEILAIVSIVYRPITLKELKVFIEALEDDDDNELEDTIGSCGSFLTVRKGVIYFVHQSARDFLLNKALDQIFPSGVACQHYAIFSKSLETLSRTLRRDIYNLQVPGLSINQVSPPDPDPLASSQYSCIYWVDHFTEGIRANRGLQDGSAVHGRLHTFLQKHLLHWLEVLSLMRKISDGIRSIISLETTISTNEYPDLHKFIQDSKRVILHYRQGIEEAPLQVYYSALIFTPESSTVRKQFEDQAPKWIRKMSKVRTDWSALQQTLEGHTNIVRAVAFSPDGRQLASASDDKTIRLWDSTTGASLQTLEGHTGWVSTVAFSPDGKQLASASEDKTVRLWDLTTGASLQTLEGHIDWVRAVAFSPDGKQLASASDDKTIRLWDSTTGASLQTLEGHTSWVNTVAFSLDSKQLASASNDETVRLWDLTTGASLQTLEGHTDWVRAVAFSPDGKQLASASDDKTVRLWDLTTGASLQTLEGHTGWVRAVAFSPDGKQLASASNDKTIRLWDLTTGASLQILEGHTDQVNTVAFSLDSKQLASASNDKTIRLWDLTTGASLQILEGHTDQVNTVAFSLDSKQLASASDDKTVRLWDLTTGASLQILEGHTDQVNTVAFSLDSKQLASASNDKTIRLWDLTTGASLQILEGHTDQVNTVAFSLDSKQLASASDDKTVRLWDLTTGASLQILEGHTHWVRAVAFSPDGKQLASASSDKAVRLWDLTTGASLQTLEGHTDWVSTVAFSPDGKQLASASDDETVRLWDSTTGAPCGMLRISVAVQKLRFSNDGQALDTDQGRLDIRTFSYNDTSFASTPGRGIFVDGPWVFQGKQRILWLPPDYRAIRVAVLDHVLAMGHASGRVSMLEICR